MLQLTKSQKNESILTILNIVIFKFTINYV
jgi:hypothetical protein